MSDLNFFFFFKDKSRNLFKFVSVLLSASVERGGVSRMRDFVLTTELCTVCLYIDKACLYCQVTLAETTSSKRVEHSSRQDTADLLSFPRRAAMEEFHMKEGEFHVTKEARASFDK